MYKDIFVPINKINKAEDGDKVLVKLADWPEKADSPYGKVIKVLENQENIVQKFMPS
jgi:ribonuclease R/exosome complex exonuclease DIS3/RRP44